MIKVVLLGYGNVGFHLYEVFSKAADIDVVQIYNHRFPSIDHLQNKVRVTDKLKDLAEADVYIIAVSDDRVSSLSNKIPESNKLVVHSSGSVPMHDLDKKHRRGVFYPLQTFSKEREVNFKEIPLCLETDDKADFKILEKLAAAIGSRSFKISTKQRQSLHLSAVFVNNFTNHLYRVGHELCEANNVPFDILKPLIRETAAKIENMTPYEAQTGPAKRDDQKTIKKQLAVLEKNSHKEIYRLMTESIQDLYGSKKL